MATIIEHSLWTITDEAAEKMCEDGLITLCSAEHLGALEIDKLIYHRAAKAPDWFGLSTLSVTINRYHKTFN